MKKISMVLILEIRKILVTQLKLNYYKMKIFQKMKRNKFKKKLMKIMKFSLKKIVKKLYFQLV